VKQKAQTNPYPKPGLPLFIVFLQSKKASFIESNFESCPQLCKTQPLNCGFKSVNKYMKHPSSSVSRNHNHGCDVQQKALCMLVSIYSSSNKVTKKLSMTSVSAGCAHDWIMACSLDEDGTAEYVEQQHQ
jgi:hypothetical protein